MSGTRGLLTAREREVLRPSSDASENYVYQVRNRVRGRIERLVDDIEFLREAQSDLYEELEAALRDVL